MGSKVMTVKPLLYTYINSKLITCYAIYTSLDLEHVHNLFAFVCVCVCVCVCLCVILHCDFPPQAHQGPCDGSDDSRCAGPWDLNN